MNAQHRWSMGLLVAALGLVPAVANAQYETSERSSAEGWDGGAGVGYRSWMVQNRVTEGTVPSLAMWGYRGAHVSQSVSLGGRGGYGMISQTTTDPAHRFALGGYASVDLGRWTQGLGVAPVVTTGVDLSLLLVPNGGGNNLGYLAEIPINVAFRLKASQDVAVGPYAEVSEAFPLGCSAGAGCGFNTAVTTLSFGVVIAGGRTN